jgi:hypothetical protein
MTHPADVMRAVRRSIKPDGTWLIVDINAKPSFEENLQGNPMAAMMYGFSVLSCLSSSLSHPEGAGLGTLGFSEPVAREMTAAAGFTRFRRHDFGNPVNAYYEVGRSGAPATAAVALAQEGAQAADHLAGAPRLIGDAIGNLAHGFGLDLAILQAGRQPGGALARTTVASTSIPGEGVPMIGVPGSRRYGSSQRCENHEALAVDDREARDEALRFVVAGDAAQVLRPPVVGIAPHQCSQVQLATELVAVKVCPELLPTPVVPRRQAQIGVERNGNDGVARRVESELSAHACRPAAHGILDRQPRQAPARAQCRVEEASASNSVSENVSQQGLGAEVGT